ASGYPTYVSAGQREAVRSAFLMRPGDTLIVCLPTGSGKSFVAQAPILTRGREGGLTLCIVPTTALVLDQARQMDERLSGRARGASGGGLAWHSDLGPDEKDLIKAAIREGRQGILYCSPEAVTGALLPSLYDAAKRGLFDYLVVDEAHLLSQWGDGFRPAFQMIAGIRRGLLRACAGERFRTILMSATLTTDAIATIDALFGPPETVHMVSSVHLRPEPQYWIHKEPGEAAKQAKVLEAVRHAPRPTILYVTKRSDADEWHRRLYAKGYRRLAKFHGDTPTSERLKIIDEWSRNMIDVIVATSAFGVGIDKSDVRAVIHAAVPETVDRFYQEVGRGGRDGAPAGSLMIYSDKDM
ncbi:MAG: ATP-dependent DNA helicase RecQ, partial [Caulobacteraceae bacterium]